MAAEATRLYKELLSKAESLGYTPPFDLGKTASECFEYRWRGAPVLAIGFRDVARKPNYSAADHLWVEGFRPIVQGGTREEALRNIREAIAGYLESLEDHQEPVPPSIHEEIVEVQ